MHSSLSHSGFFLELVFVRSKRYFLLTNIKSLGRIDLKTQPGICQGKNSISKTHYTSPVPYDICLSSPKPALTHAAFCKNSKGTALLPNLKLNPVQTQLSSITTHSESKHTFLCTVLLQNTHTSYNFLLNFLSDPLGLPHPPALPFMTARSLLSPISPCRSQYSTLL